MLVLRIVVGAVGALVVAGTGLSAVRTLLVPRAVPIALSRVVLQAMRVVYRSTMRPGGRSDPERLDRRFASYAPVSLLVLVAVWLALDLVGYALVYWALAGSGARAAVEVSGSSLLTLGFAAPDGPWAVIVSVAEAATGIALLALLITFLPSIYSAFQRREALVALLEVRAGTPPWAVTMLERYHAIGLSARADELWQTAEAWFADVQESHTSLAALSFLRSPQPGLHWVTAAGALLDGASLTMALVETPDPQPNAALCVRSGYLALRRIADYFGITYDPDPRPSDPISLSRADFDVAVARLAAAGVPLQADRDQAWRDFAGWRVNYDAVLLALASLTYAPSSPWLTTAI